jgi:hypothetical protein
MWLLSKNKSKVSSRKQMQLKEVRDGILILPNNRYRMVLETSSVNFELKSDEEQDVLLDGYQNFLNSLPSRLQILIKVREVDVASYLEQISKSKDTEKEAVYREQIDNYTEFIRKVISGNKILTRKFYIIIPYDHSGRKNDFSVIREQMILQKDLVQRGLEKLGMKARCLDTLEVLHQFYSFYNSKQAKSQELTKDTLKQLLEDSYA